MKNKLYLLLSIIILIILAIISIIIVNKPIKPKIKTIDTESIIESSTEKESTIEETKEIGKKYVSPIDFETLWKKNKDIIAWIKIPNTNIDYPILWNGDNEYYLHHDIDGNKTVAGSIFLDMDDKPDFSSKHNIFYGHNMKNKSMFQNIIKFKNKDFFEQNRDIYIYTKDKEYHLKTMAALYTDASVDKRQVEFETDEEFKAYIDRMTEKNSYRQIPSDDIDKLWSFITCSYEFNDARTILYAYEVEDE